MKRVRCGARGVRATPLATTAGDWGERGAGQNAHSGEPHTDEVRVAGEPVTVEDDGPEPVDVAVRGVQVVRAVPSGDLQSVVRCYAVVRVRGDALVAPMIAMNQPRLAFDMTPGGLHIEWVESHHVLREPTVSGLASRPFTLRAVGEAHAAFFVDLTDVGFFALFGDAAATLTDGNARLWDLLPDRCRANVVEEIREASSDPARCRIVERFLRSLLSARALDRAERLGRPVVRVRASSTLPSVRTLAEEAGVSQTLLRRRFHELTGTSPKGFLGRERARRALHALRADPGATGADIAQRVGCFDQAHLIREVRRYAGATPQRLREPTYEFAAAATFVS